MAATPTPLHRKPCGSVGISEAYCTAGYLPAPRPTRLTRASPTHPRALHLGSYCRRFVRLVVVVSSKHVMFNAKSELARHCEPGGTRDDEDDSWIIAGENESVDSFLTNCPPSYMEKSWISAQHDGMTKLVEEYYTKTMGAEGVKGSNEESWGRDNMEEIKTAWEESETKTLETLTEVLKAHKYGSGKWMIFVPASDVDTTWRKVVTALWDGKLGHSAKVSGNTPECNGSHVINVYVDPFWEKSEVERVLAALRELCGVTDAIKYKADGVTQLGLYKGNEYGIPPSFYAANRNSSVISVQRSSAASGGGAPPGLEGAKLESARSSSNNDKWSARSNTFEPRKKPMPRSAPPPEKPKDKPKLSAFAALSGVDDDDPEAILAKKAAKKAKKLAKLAAAEEAAVAKSEKSFEALKAGLKGDWGDEEDEEDEGHAPDAAEEEEDESTDDSSEEEEEEEEEEAEAAPSSAPAAVDVTDAAPEKPKEKTKEELEVEALLAALDEPKAGGGADEPKGMSKAAAKRAKKKAAAAGEAAPAAGAAGDSNAAEGAASEQNGAENAGENADAAPKSAEDIKKLLAAKAAAKKKKDGSSSSAAAAILAEAKAREAAAGGKKKQKGPKTWESGGKQVGQKARGSDNKYQGE